MHPLPACASGEWGPAKAQRHFGIEALSHPGPVVNTETGDVELRFRPRHGSIDVLCRLRTNGLTAAAAGVDEPTDAKTSTGTGGGDRSVRHRFNSDGTLTVSVALPSPGQYGVDIYARFSAPAAAASDDSATSGGRKKSTSGGGSGQSLVHACKYLINYASASTAASVSAAGRNPSFSSATPADASRAVQMPRGLPPQNGSGGGAQNGYKPGATAADTRSSLNRGCGPTPDFDRLGLRTLSHGDPIVIVPAVGAPLRLEIGLTEPLRLTYRLTREPDGVDVRDAVAVKDSGKKIRFTVALPPAAATGSSYRFALYAGRKTDAQKIHVFDYILQYDVGIGGAGGAGDELRKKGKGFFKR